MCYSCFPVLAVQIIFYQSKSMKIEKHKTERANSGASDSHCFDKSLVFFLKVG